MVGTGAATRLTAGTGPRLRGGCRDHPRDYVTIVQVFASLFNSTKLSNGNTTDQDRAASTGPKSLDVRGVLGHSELCPALEADKEGQDNG